jgi:Tol biopolymer transport system component
VSGTLAYTLCQGQFCNRGWIETWQLSDGQARSLTPRPGPGEQRLDTNPAWSSDGTSLSFVRVSPRKSGIYRIGTDGKGLIVALDRRNARAASVGAWSPDGTKLAFDRFGAVECSATKPFRHRLSIISLDSGGVSDLNALPRAITLRELGQVAWSPDGMKLLYIVSDAEILDGRCRFHRSNTELYTTGRDGRNRRQVVARSEMPGSVAWSPDGTQIAYVDCGYADVAGCDLTVVEADGSNPQTIVSGDVPLPGSSSYWPTIAWSAKGDEVLAIIESPHYQKPVALVAINASNGRPRRLSLKTGEILGLTPDNHGVVVFGNDLTLVPLAGGAATTVGSPPVPKGTFWGDTDLYLR